MTAVVVLTDGVLLAIVCCVVALIIGIFIGLCLS